MCRCPRSRHSGWGSGPCPGSSSKGSTSASSDDAPPASVHIEVKEGRGMAQLKGSKTHENLKAAFAGESMANRRYLYFAKVADVEGHPEIAGNFRDTAEGETGHAHGHLDYLRKCGDPATYQPVGDTVLNLKSAEYGETPEYTEMYPWMAKTAR